MALRRRIAPALLLSDMNILAKLNNAKDDLSRTLFLIFFVIEKTIGKRWRDELYRGYQEGIKRDAHEIERFYRLQDWNRINSWASPSRPPGIFEESPFMFFISRDCLRSHLTAWEEDLEGGLHQVLPICFSR